MALALAARALLRPGDAIAVEDPGYRFAWEAFRQSGATLVPVPVDAGGLDVAALARIAARSPIRAVYITPQHQLPTTVTLTAERRQALLNMARAHRFVVIEDDYDHEFHFTGRPAVPLASLDPALVLYVGTFSKTLAPALRIGYLAAPVDIIEQLSAYRQAIDLQGDPAMEAALAELIDEGEVQRHVRRVKRIYGMRRDLLAALLERYLPDAVAFTVPAGGIGLWAQAAPGIDVDRFASSSLRRGVAFLTARSFTFDGGSGPFLRLGYACLDEAELRAAVERMAHAIEDLRAQSRVVNR
jgi:GntR family transcriptional regulator/MocR family aminotransferase